MGVLLEYFEHLKNLINEWYWIPGILIYLFVLITILIEFRNPTKTIAWILVISFLPIAGIIIYFFFGQNFKKVKKLNENTLLEKLNIFQQWEEVKDKMQNDLIDLENKIGALAHVFHSLSSQFISPVTYHNHVKLLINGEQKFPQLLEDLNKAVHHIHLEYYIFENDKIGNQIINLLNRKAEKGVIVRVILDDFGSPKIKKIFKKLNASGVQTKMMLPVAIGSLANSNYRDHRKIVIIDGLITYVGGINISDRYINLPDYPKKSNIYWRDTAVRIEGNAAHILQIYFWNNWDFDHDQEMYLTKAYFPNPKHWENYNTPVSYTFSHPGYEFAIGHESILTAISAAKKRIEICTPYFIPSEELITALSIAASYGVEVSLMLPYKSDSHIVHYASLSFLKLLLKRGVAVYLYQKGFIHAKTITIDNHLAFIGTINLDQRSFFINFEIAAIIYEDNLVTELHRQFETDKESSLLLKIKDWESMSWIKRGFAALCRLLAPVL